VRKPVAEGKPVVVKVGSTSITGSGGHLDNAAIESLVQQIVALRSSGNPPVLVSSGAIAAGLPGIGLSDRPHSISDLQVAAAVGQSKLMAKYGAAFERQGISVGQVLLTKDVLGSRVQYLNARAALERMIALGIVPIINENDTVAVDEVRLGDNDQLAAIAAHLVGADMLVILTDTAGLYLDDPRISETAQFLAAVEHTDKILDKIRQTTTKGALGSGGVSTKIAAARMAAYSGVPTVIAPSASPDSVARAVAGEDVGTWIDPRPEALPARKLWIAFGVASSGSIHIDAGAEKAVRDEGRSLLAAGITQVVGSFQRAQAVEVTAADGSVVAKGLVRLSASEVTDVIGSHTSVAGGEVIHRDDLVLMDDSAR